MRSHACLSWFAAAVSSLALVACQSEDSGANHGCTAGEVLACTCPDGGEGLATCDADGVLGVCVCDGGGGSGGTGGTGGTGGAEPVAHHWVTAAIDFPTTASAADQLGVDVDGDGTIDNALGRSLASFGAASFVSIDEAVASGQLIQLHELTATSLEGSAEATWEVFVGDPVESPDYSGAGSFTANTSLGKFDGSILLGRFEAEPGSLVFTLPMLGVGAPLPLERARITADVTEGGCDGMAGGAVSEALLVTGVSLALNAAVEAEGCGPDVPCSTQLQAVLDLLDANDDFTVTPEEISGNMMWGVLFSPDIDLDDDGTADALSIGWGFSCVGATFEPPAGN